jgi:hypothetical protein
MKRKHLLVISAVIAWLLGLMMMFMPDKMEGNLVISLNENLKNIHLLMQAVGAALFSIGWINFLARNDAGSKALNAILVGNILIHALNLAFDSYNYSQGAVTLSGIMTGGIIHVFLLIGFIYFLFKKEKAVHAA